jgi:hypothetical protein
MISTVKQNQNTTSIEKSNTKFVRQKTTVRGIYFNSKCRHYCHVFFVQHGSLRVKYKALRSRPEFVSYSFGLKGLGNQMIFFGSLQK